MIFWNEDLAEDTRGLDILGIRAIDQKLEANLVNGITTISARGRYFSILPWAINQFYVETLSQDAVFDPNELGAFLHRAEFLIIAASLLDPGGNPGGAILGSDVYREDIARLKAGNPISFPKSTGSRMLGTYYSPCKAIGLLRDSAIGRPVPYQLTERGKKIWEARDDRLKGSPLLALLANDRELTPELVHNAVPHFSLISLDLAEAEAVLLREAFQSPWPVSSGHEVIIKERYARFSNTLHWISDHIEESAGSANRILSRNFESCSKSQRQDSSSIAWGDYEWRRRQHYALELLLSSACGILSLAGDLSIDEIIAVVKDQIAQRDDLADLWPEAKEAWKKSAAEAVASVPDDLMLGTPLPFAVFNQLRPAQQMLGAFAIIASLEKQTSGFRNVDLDRSVLSTSDLTLKLVSNAGVAPFEKLLRALLETCALLPHLHVTLRKMSNQQKCSLRFFPDGEKLRLTATQSGAGFSGSRLDNTLNILVDIGLLARREDGSLQRIEAA